MPDAPPRILFVITDLRLGGVPLHLRRLVAAVRKESLRVTVVSLSPGGEVAGMLREDGVEVLDCAGRGGRDLRIIPRLARIIQSRKPQLIHSFLFHANLAARIATTLIHYPADRLLCEIQTVEVERPWHLILDHATHQWCRLTIGNSPSVIDHLHRVAGIPLSRLRLIRGGIDSTALAGWSPPAMNLPLPCPDDHRDGSDQADRWSENPLSSLRSRRAGIPAGLSHIPLDAPIILWVGRLDPIKGLPGLIDAFQTLARQTTAHLLLAGDGPMRPVLERQIRDTNLTTRVHLLGPRRDVPDLLRAADLFVFPSRTEGLPNALLEAMAAGLPIVATDVPGCRDLIVHTVSGLLVPYDDPDALAAAMLTLLTDRESAAKMALNARVAVVTHWNIHHTHAAYLSLYGDIFTSARPQTV